MSNKQVFSDKEIEEFIAGEHEEYLRTLRSKDNPTEVILKFHLYFEHMFERIINGVLKRGDRLLDKGNLSYYQKLVLVDSFDIVSDKYIVVLRHLNSLRNKLSHVKETIITLDDLDLIGRPLGSAYSNIKR